MKKLLLLFAAVGMVFTACQSGGDVEEGNGGTPFVPEITISPKDLTFGCNGGEQAVDITANFEYEFAERASWLTVEQTDEGLLVVVDANKNTSERSAFISITNSQYDINKTVEVWQEGFVPKIELAQQSIEVEFEPAEYEVAVTSPYSWEATTKNDWIAVESKTGIAGEEKLKFTTLRNEEETERKGTITLKNSDYNLVAELYVTQKAFVPAITIEPETLTFAVEGGTQEIAITANFEYAYSSNADWLTIEKSEKGISVTVPNYVEVDERTAEITISNEKYGVSKVVNVTQGAFVPAITIEPESLAFAVEGGTQEIAITANFEYAYSSNADWLTIKKSEKGISVTAQNNVEVDKRTAEITISNEKYGVSKVISVAQGAFVPELTVSPESLNFAVVGGTQEVKITANFEYAYSENADWLTIEKSEKGISVIAQNNVQVDERTAEITISNEKYGKTRIVKVTQGAFVPELNVDTTEISIAELGESKSVKVTSNIPWNATCDANWVTISPAKGEKGETTIKITTRVNSSSVDSSIIKVANDEYNQTVTINIKQPTFWGIFYTSSNGTVVTPYESNVFGANIVSNTYSNGQGIIIFDAPVTSIGDWAFYDCTSLTSVTIPDSVTSIGYRAFYNCKSLTSVTIGNSVTSIGEYAFYECTSLTSVTIPDSVTSIGEDAFRYCTSLTSVTIGNSVTSIGVSAFYDCSSLTAFYGKFASADNRCLIVDGVLNSFAPAGLTRYTIPDSVTSIGDVAFAGCTSLKSVTIGNGVTSIGDSAFSGCTSLTSVTIPDSVTSIGERAFDFCTSLKSIKIGNSVTSIGYRAFYYCTSLTSITIGNNIASIGGMAFCACKSLTSITIPDSVTSIGNAAFSGCTSLTSVYCKPTTPPTGGSDMFDDNASGRKIYVPYNSVSAYKSAEYWSVYKSYIEGYDF